MELGPIRYPPKELQRSAEEEGKNRRKTSVERKDWRRFIYGFMHHSATTRVKERRRNKAREGKGED